MAGKEKGKAPKKDKFWLIVIVGVIGVTALSWILGSFVASRIMTKSSKPAISLDVASEDSADAQARADRIGAVDEPEVTIESSHPRGSENKQEDTSAQTDAETQKATQGVSIESNAQPQNSQNDDDLLMTDEEKPSAQNEAAMNAPVTLYKLQLGAFTDKENATSVKQQIESEFNIPVYVGTVTTSQGTQYKVQAGVFTSKENAEKMARQLQLKGFRTHISSEEKKP